MELSEKLFEAVFKLVTTESVFPPLPWMGNNTPKPLLTVKRLIENGADTSQSSKKAIKPKMLFFSKISIFPNSQKFVRLFFNTKFLNTDFLYFYHVFNSIYFVFCANTIYFVLLTLKCFNTIFFVFLT